MYLMILITKASTTKSDVFTRVHAAQLHPHKSTHVYHRRRRKTISI